MPDFEERIRERAHRIWQDLGEPEGQDEAIWHQAERQIKQEDDTRPDPPRVGVGGLGRKVGG